MASNLSSSLDVPRVSVNSKDVPMEQLNSYVDHLVPRLVLDHQYFAESPSSGSALYRPLVHFVRISLSAFLIICIRL